jgi:hypothetical protein
VISAVALLWRLYRAGPNASATTNCHIMPAIISSQ